MRLREALASIIIRTGGVSVILAILALMLLFLVEIFPLWRPARVEERQRFTPADLPILRQGRPLLIGTEEYLRIAYFLLGNGRIVFINVATGQELGRFRFPLQEDEQISCAWQSFDGTRVAVGTDQGRVLPAVINYNPQFDGDQKRRYAPAVHFEEPLDPGIGRIPFKILSLAEDADGRLTLAAATRDHEVYVYRREVETTLFGAGETTEHLFKLPAITGAPTGLALNSEGTRLFLATSAGWLYKVTIDQDAEPGLSESIQASDTAITQIGFLIGRRSLVVGDARGNLSVWFETFDAQNQGPLRLRRVHQMASHQTAVTSFSPSQRNRSFLTGSHDGELLLQYSTTERLLFRGRVSNVAIRAIYFAPKGDAALVLTDDAELRLFSVYNPHPEAGWKTFFGKVWYEGYPGPDYVWQSSSGSDDFEPKLSLVPLIFGTLKGTFYALVFALPIAVLAAIYVSQFMHPKWKHAVKPVMEIMAAMPSVIIGFIGGLWLAPKIQKVIPGVFAMLVVMPLITVWLSWLWQKFSFRLKPDALSRKRRSDGGLEFLLIAPVVVLSGWVCLQVSPALETLFFAGDFQQWLVDTLNLTYDQRNAFVVGIVMGFAVIPLIFTISEDSLSNVPTSLKAASLALGATPWQTTLRVVLPTAMPGIFSAVMIGLGRAIGETMIVLMATGNTPVMDWNLFNGYRTLSANIAVEIPEAPVGGTLYRTLFLSALLLFIMTFVVNTIAEVVRQRMRKKYEHK